MRVPAIIVALSALLAAGSVHAQPAVDGFEMFKSACVANKADPALAIAEADAKSWKPVPSAMLTTMIPGLKDAQNMQARILLTSATNGMTLVTGDDVTIPTSAGAAASDHTRMCMMVVGGAPDQSIKSAVTTWMGGAAAMSDNTALVYIFTETNGVRRFLTKADGADKAAEQLYKDGKVSAVILAMQPQVTIFSYITPNRAN